MCFAELKGIEILFNFCLYIFKFGYGLAVYISKLPTFRHNAIPIFLRKLQGTVYEVAVNGHKLRVVTLLEVFPREVIVFCFRCIGGKNISQNILLAGEIAQVFVKPDGPITAG